MPDHGVYHLPPDIEYRVEREENFPQDDDSLTGISRAIRSRWLLVLLSAILCGAASVGVSFLLAPTYRVEVLLSPSSMQPQQGRLEAALGSAGIDGLMSLAGINIPSLSSGGKQEAIATLQSRQVAAELIQRRSLLPVLFASQWNESKKRWTTTNPKKMPTLWDGVERFRKKIGLASVDRKTGLVVLEVQWRDAKQATEWANDLVSIANSLLSKKEIARRKRHLQYLQEQADKTSIAEVRQAIYRLIETDIKEIAVIETTDEYGFTVVDPAMTPTRRAWPNRQLLGALGLTLGLITAVVYSVLRSAPTRPQVDARRYEEIARINPGFLAKTSPPL
jgi:uncharacterized protein involved in exopolysaccharide biosynthesis